VSEKSYTLIDQGKYTFEVDPRATKTEIKLARYRENLQRQGLLE
jgi:ribosomal protein L23